MIWPDFYDACDLLRRFRIDLPCSVKLIDSEELSPDSWMLELQVDRGRFILYGEDIFTGLDTIAADVAHLFANNVAMTFVKTLDTLPSERRPEMLYSTLFGEDLVYLLQIKNPKPDHSRKAP